MSSTERYPAGGMFDEFIQRTAQSEHDDSGFLTARQHLDHLEGDVVLLERARKSVDAITAFVEVTQPDSEQPTSLIDLFTLDQILEMEELLRTYLDTDVDAFLAKPGIPRGYSVYVERLSYHFSLSDDVIASNFGAFERRHTDPQEHARGPTEDISRNYAAEANERMLRQFKTYYQLGTDFVLQGPVKRDGAGGVTWERGVAECQFLILDFMRDAFAGNIDRKAAIPPRTNTMTREDIGINIANLLTHKVAILERVNRTNPLLGAQVGMAIDNLSSHTRPVIYHGRRGAPHYLREPGKAESDINIVAKLLKIAEDLERMEDGQADIPVLDI